MEKIGWADRVKSEVVRRMKEEINVLHKIKRRKAIGIVTFCVGNAFRNILLMERAKGREDEEEDSNSHCMTVRK
jgi:hypothetical protein